MKTKIKSRDPVKAEIVAALKKQTQADKVTNVYQIGENDYQGDCLRYLKAQGRYETLGTHVVVMVTPVGWAEARAQGLL